MLIAILSTMSISSQIKITEVMSDGGIADWFELTNMGKTDVNTAGGRVDDDSNDFSKLVALNGVSTLAAGQSVIFIETDTPESTIPAFRTFWGTDFNNIAIGSYTGSGVGLGSGGDGVIVFDAKGLEVHRVNFGSAVTGNSFYWVYNAEAAVIESATLSAVGTRFGSKSNQVTVLSANTLGNIASPGSALLSPTSSNATLSSKSGWRMYGNTLVFDTLPSSSIEVYSISGAKVLSLPPAGSIELNLNRDIYIVRVDGNASKVLLR